MVFLHNSVDVFLLRGRRVECLRSSVSCGVPRIIGLSPEHRFVAQHRATLREQNVRAKLESTADFLASSWQFSGNVFR